MLTGFVWQYGRLVRTLFAVRVLDGDDILCITPFARYSVLLEVTRDTRIHHQPFVGRTDTEYMLRDGEPVPCGGAGQPTVLPFARFCCLFTGYHLAIYIGFHFMQVLVGNPCRRNLTVQVPRVHTIREYIANNYMRDTGRTPNRFIIDYRLGIAARLLLTTKMSVSDVNRKAVRRPNSGRGFNRRSSAP